MEVLTPAFFQSRTCHGLGALPGAPPPARLFSGLTQGGVAQRFALTKRTRKGLKSKQHSQCHCVQR